MGLKVLLLQARRADDPMRHHEHACFVSRTGLPSGSVVSYDLCLGPPALGDLQRYDALMVGGSGEFYVSKRNLPNFDAFLDFLREVVTRGHPTFASCFGFQGIVQALGGEIARDRACAEVGTFELTLSEAGKADALFGTLPGRFLAQMGHVERVERFAPGILNLAASERCAWQALRVPGQPIWATQFHPELEQKTNLERFRRYAAAYAPGTAAERAAIEAGFRESIEASALLGRFLDLVFSLPP